MRRSYLTIVFLCMLMLQSTILFAQKDYNKAKKHYDNFEYQLAIPYYRVAVGIDSSLESIEQLADCYRQTNQYKEAIKYYKIALDIPYYNSISVFHLAEMLFKIGDYREAENQYSFYLNYEPSNAAYVKARMESCKYAKQLRSAPLAVGIENVKELNTKYAETGVCFANNNLYFSSDRKIGSSSLVDGWTGNSYYKIFVSQVKESNAKVALQRAKLFDVNINKGYHVLTPSFSNDFKKMYYSYTTFEKKSNKKFQIKKDDFINRINSSEAELVGKRWQKTKDVKSEQEFSYSILHPCINAEGDRLYFASDMPGGYGSYDIYYCNIDTGVLSAPINAGPIVNSVGMELYPSMAKDSVLYFSSNGHLGLGGLDIYKAIVSETNIKTVQNLGFPINSSYDDFSYIILEKFKIAYFCSDREGGKGKDDIYKVMWSK